MTTRWGDDHRKPIDSAKTARCCNNWVNAKEFFVNGSPKSQASVFTRVKVKGA